MAKDMLGRDGILSRAAAQRRFLERLGSPRPAEESVAVAAARGRVVSRPVVSPEDLPAFARSAMDGYAVRARDTFGASEGLPAYLRVVGEVAMGRAAAVEAGPGEAVRIATGGMLPAGADAVVMLEYTAAAGEDLIEVTRPAAQGENVIRAGEDVRRGRTVLEPGHRIRPQEIGLLSGLGVREVQVFRRVRVEVIPTGDEVVSAEAAPGPGQVRDMNSPHLAALLERDGAVPRLAPVVGDDLDRLREAVARGLESCDMVLLSGGSSVGARDLTSRVLAELEPDGVVVQGVAVKPGKPTLCALVGGKPVVGLPGHPAAVAVAYQLFVRPVVRILSGERRPCWGWDERAAVRARMARNVASRPGREEYLRVALEGDPAEGGLRAVPLLGKSGLLSTLVRAHGTVVVPAGRPGLEQGEEVEVLLFPEV